MSGQGRNSSNSELWGPTTIPLWCIPAKTKRHFRPFAICFWLPGTYAILFNSLILDFLQMFCMVLYFILHVAIWRSQNCCMLFVTYFILYVFIDLANTIMEELSVLNSKSHISSTFFINRLMSKPRARVCLGFFFQKFECLARWLLYYIS